MKETGNLLARKDREGRKDMFGRNNKKDITIEGAI